MQRIFVGDIQGCAVELRALVRRATEHFGDGFALYCVGDLVNRGPDSLGVLSTLRELHAAGRARLVLGNHDIALIACHLGLRSPHRRDTIGPLLAAPDADDWIGWLRSLPLVESGEIGGTPFVMVHAAVHPDWSLAELVARARAVEVRLAGTEDEARRLLRATRLGPPGTPDDADADLLDRLTCCRSVGEGELWSSAEPEERAEPTLLEAWHKRWLARSHAYGVVYGHWARQGLHVAARLRGLDTGCVHHRTEAPTWLTAWLPDLAPAEDGGAFGAHDERFWRENARRRYAPSHDAATEPS